MRFRFETEDAGPFADGEALFGDGSVLSSQHRVFGSLAVHRLLRAPSRVRLTLPEHAIIVGLGHGPRVRLHTTGHYDTWDVLPGRAVIQPAGATVDWRWDGPLDVLHLHIKPSVLEAALADGARAAPDGGPLAFEVGVEDSLIGGLAQALLPELAEPTKSGRLFADSAGITLALHLLRRRERCGAPAVEATLPPQQRAMQEAIAFMQSNLGRDIKLIDIAKRVGMSPYHFARTFKHITGQSPHQYLLRLRLERASEMLRGSALPLAEIAYRVGFANQSHFTTAFRKHTGHTPKRFRDHRPVTEGAPVGDGGAVYLQEDEGDGYRDADDYVRRGGGGPRGFAVDSDDDHGPPAE